MIAGGIGITPFLGFLPLLKSLGVPLALHWFAREGDEAALDAWLAPHRDSLVLHRSARARLAEIELLLAAQPIGTALSCCAPPTLQAAIEAQVARLAWPAGWLSSERFVAAGGRAFDLHLARSGRQLRVAADESVLEACERAGITVRSQCRGGACGACRTTVLAGAVEHRDHVLDARTRDRQRTMMICVSRAAGDALELDL